MCLWQVFLAPTGLAGPQVLRMARRLLLGSNVKPGCNANDYLNLHIDIWRLVATGLIRPWEAN